MAHEEENYQQFSFSVKGGLTDRRVISRHLKNVREREREEQLDQTKREKAFRTQILRVN